MKDLPITSSTVNLLVNVESIPIPLADSIGGKSPACIGCSTLLGL